MEEKLKIYLTKFWKWISPYLIQLKNHFIRIWRKFHIGKILILLGLIISLFATISLYIYAKVEDVEDLKAGIEQVTTVYDRNEEEAGTLYSQRGTYVSIKEMSPELIDAVIATEDTRFYKHKGFDIIGIGRAAVQYVLKGGQISGGGSTITQQLAKNSFLTLDQTLIRKLKELFLSIEIEKEYTKDEILEMYFNKSYFGNGVWGVEDAAHKYFGKSAVELNLAESATLVGMLKGPSNYNPIDDMEKAIGRRNIVLDLMVNNETITRDTAVAVQQENLTLVDNYQESNGYKYPYYFDAVISEAIKHGFSEEEILGGGYKIYTSLDQTYQQEMDQVYEKDGYFEDASDGTLLQSASIMLDSKTGGVLAVIGGRGEHSFRGYNRATQATLQPGSVLKPLSIYTPALEKNYDLDSILPDEEGLKFGEDNYSVSNATNQYLGEVPLYQAVADSLNVPAVWLLNEIGLNAGIKSLSKFGIKVTNEEDKNLSAIALGGMDKGVSPLDIASAYTGLANGGIRSKGYFITKIVDSTGAVVVDNEKPKQNRATSPEVAEKMTSLLIGVFTNGTGERNKPAGYTIAGKTGSTQLTFENEYNGTKDQWTVGYTPDIVLTTWMGFDHTDEEHHMTTSSAALGVGPLFKAQMEQLLPQTPLTAFETKSAETLVAEENPQEDWKEDIKESVDNLKEKINDGVSTLKEKTSGWLNGVFGN